MKLAQKNAREIRLTVSRAMNPPPDVRVPGSVHQFAKAFAILIAPFTVEDISHLLEEGMDEAWVEEQERSLARQIERCACVGVAFAWLERADGHARPNRSDAIVWASCLFASFLQTRLEPPPVGMYAHYSTLIGYWLTRRAETELSAEWFPIPGMIAETYERGTDYVTARYNGVCQVVRTCWEHLPQ